MFVVNIDKINDSKAWYKRFYQFFDYNLEVRADSRSLLEELDVFLGRFCVQEEKGEDVYYLISDQSVFGVPAICIGRKGYSVSDERYLASYALLLIISNLSMRITSHFLFHAGSLHYQGKGFIITGSPGGGKSTLIMELLRRGFQFLSDDTTAMGVRDYRIYPFPLPLRMHENGMSLFRETASSHFTSAPMLGEEEREYIMKEVSDSEQNSFHFDYLICLYPKRSFYASSSDSGQSQGNVFVQKEQKGSTYAIIDRLDEEMIREWRKDLRIEEVKISPRGYFYKIEIVWSHERFRFSELEDICSRYKISLFTVSYEQSEMADYQFSPAMERMNNSKVALELLKRFRGGVTSVSLPEELKTNPGLLLMKMGDVGRDAQGYFLTPGRLNEMADQVCDLI